MFSIIALSLSGIALDYGMLPNGYEKPFKSESHCERMLDKHINSPRLSKSTTVVELENGYQVTWLKNKLAKRYSDGETTFTLSCKYEESTRYSKK